MTKYIRVKQVSEITTLKQGTLYNLHSRGEGPPVIRINGRLLYAEDEVYRWIESHATVKAPGA